MTYVEIRNELRRQHRTEHFKSSDLLVFGLLVDECNAKRWQNPFVIRISFIEKELDMERSIVRRSFDRLKDRGLITYSIGDRGQGRIVMLNWADISDDNLWNQLNISDESCKDDVSDARPQTDHKPTTNQPQTNHKPTTNFNSEVSDIQNNRSEISNTATTNRPQTDRKPTIDRPQTDHYIYKDKDKDKDKILDNKNNNNLLTRKRTRTQEEVELEIFDALMQEILDDKHQIWVNEIRMKHGIDNIADYLPDFRSHAILNAKVGSVSNINDFKYYFNVSFRYFQKRTPIQLWQQSRDSAEDENFRRFCDWIIRDYVNIARDINPPTQKELEYLIENYGRDKVFSTIMELNNRKNLTQRYFSLYRTLLNWINRKDAND